MENDENWAKTEDPEVESDKAAYAEAQYEESLRYQLTQATAGAVKNGVDRDWANTRLVALGAQPVTGTAEYRMNLSITGLYGWRCKAGSRAEALARFNEQITRLTGTGKITAYGSYDNVYSLAFHGDPTFYSGPEDIAQAVDKVPGGDDLKVAIRDFLKAAVLEQGWGHSYAQSLLNSMGIEPLPELRHRKVTVPVSGAVEISVPTFDGATDEEVQAAAAATISRSKYVSVQAEEVGQAQYTGRMLPEDDGDDLL